MRDHLDLVERRETIVVSVSSRGFHSGNKELTRRKQRVGGMGGEIVAVVPRGRAGACWLLLQLYRTSVPTRLRIEGVRTGTSDKWLVAFVDRETRPLRR